MSVPMKVMMSTIIIESGSSANARSTVTRPAVNMFHSVSCRKRCSAGSARSWMKAASAVRKASSIAPTPTTWTSCCLPARSKRQPKTAFTQAPRSGNSGMSQR